MVKRGDIKVARNFTDIEFVIRGNLIKRGDLQVVRNTGPVPKLIEDNTGGERLLCRDNTAPLSTVENKSWEHKLGQCA